MCVVHVSARCARAHVCVCVVYVRMCCVNITGAARGEFAHGLRKLELGWGGGLSARVMGAREVMDDGVRVMGEGEVMGDRVSDG